MAEHIMNKMMKQLPILTIVLSTLLILMPLATSDSLPKQTDIYEAQCDDGQDNVIGNPIYAAVLLANTTLSQKLADDTDFEHSTAFSHYFTPSDYPTVQKMFRAIDDFTWRPDIRTPSLWYLCPQPENTPLACMDANYPNRLVYSDPDSHPYTWDPSKWLPETGFGFCPRFFVPGEPLVNTFVWKKEKSEWCKSENRVDDLYTAGVLTMKLFTGSDAYGLIAGLPARPVTPEPGIWPRSKTHGTTTFTLPNTSPAAAARRLKALWTDFRAKDSAAQQPPIERVQNAPSYAAAATEWYFLTYCGRNGSFEIGV